MSWVTVGVAAASLVMGAAQQDQQGRRRLLETAPDLDAQGGEFNSSLENLSGMLTAREGSQPRANIKADKPPETPQGAMLRKGGAAARSVADFLDQIESMQGGQSANPPPESPENAVTIGGEPLPPPTTMQTGQDSSGSGINAGQISSIVTQIAPLLMQASEGQQPIPFQPRGPGNFIPSLSTLGQGQTQGFARANLSGGGGGGLDLETLLRLLALRGGA